jgi:hypothetical protein
MERTCSSAATMAFMADQKTDVCTTTRAVAARRNILAIFA